MASPATAMPQFRKMHRARLIDYWIEQHSPKIRRFTPHDLRSTMKSHLRKLVYLVRCQKCALNHKLPG